ncbi:MAG: chalcone isomerase family protein [Rugosibacter sp.]|nr:chalcone isomerase family protein [Rugosibacter sp.]
MKILLIALLLAAELAFPSLALPATALRVEGVRFDASAKVGAGKTPPAVLNGAGIRGVLFIKAYAIALYLPHPAVTVADALATTGAKRLQIVTLRKLTAKQFAESAVKGIRKNHDEAELAALNPRIELFRTTVLALGDVPTGTVIRLDWQPVAVAGEGATRLTVNGRQVGADVPGEDFYRALLRIWLGDKPADGALKAALLGQVA